MHTYLLHFLKFIEHLVPPPPKCHHAITFALFGSDQTGWEEKVALQINKDGKFHCFFLDEDDFKMESGAELAHKIAFLVSEPVENEQLGVGFGQYKA